MRGQERDAENTEDKQRELREGWSFVGSASNGV
jgi:hypothetical protein